MPNKDRNIPKRRFKEFENADAWELHPLREIGNTYTGLSGKTKDDFGHGDGRFVTYMNVFSNPISLPEMVEEVEFDESQNTVRYGDVLFTTSSETPEEVGMSSVWLENTENTYLNSFCFGFRPVKKVNPYYLAYLLRSSGMRRKISFLAQGISRYNISKAKMMELEISIPNENEQSAIGTFFSTLDQHITLHQRKLDKLKSVKQAYLSEIFPAEGERVPKRRFPGFTDAWELRRIFEIADRFDNLRIPIASSLRVPGSTPYYGANGIQDYVEGYTHDGEFVLVAEDGANDLKNYPVNLVNGKIWVNNHAHVLQGKENIANNNFLSYSINRANIEVLLVGGGRAKLNSDVLMDIELEIPSLPEQEAIGTFFSTLDQHITLHQRKS